MSSVRHSVETHPVAAFVALAFGISWGVPGVVLLVGSVLSTPVSLAGYSPVAYVAVWGPAIAAVSVVWMTDGLDGTKRYLRRVTTVSGTWPWYAAVALGIPLVYLVAALVSARLGGPAVGLGSGWVEPFVVVSLLRLTQGPVEELGWRGFALPLLQRRFSGLGASLVVGFVWSLWHVPALVVSAAEFQRGNGALAVELVRLFVGLTATSVVVTVVYNGTGGSVPLAILFHWLTNLPYPWETASEIPLTQDVVTVLVAVVVATTIGRRYLRRTNLATDVLGPDDSGTDATLGSESVG